jgi:undecaprenyl pyrophosphate phosphatase UppP
VLLAGSTSSRSSVVSAGFDGILLHFASVHDDAHKTTREEVQWRAEMEMVGLVCCGVLWPGLSRLEEDYLNSMHFQKILF